MVPPEFPQHQDPRLPQQSRRNRPDLFLGGRIDLDPTHLGLVSKAWRDNLQLHRKIKSLGHCDGVINGCSRLAGDERNTPGLRLGRNRLWLGSNITGGKPRESGQSPDRRPVRTK